MLRAQHEGIADALSGRKLDVLEQCVPIEALAASDASLTEVSDVAGLSVWLHSSNAQCTKGGATNAPACALLTAGPAAGKTVSSSHLNPLCCAAP